MNYPQPQPPQSPLITLPNYMTGIPQPSYGSGIPYNQASGGYGAFPATANSMNPAGGPGNSLSQAWQNNPMGVIGQGVSAFGTLASIYSGFKALDLAEDQFSFQKKAWNKNYNNQVKDYQNQLKDRWAAWDSAASARGNEFESMASWVGSRELSGKPTESVGGDYSGYRAGSAQDFYKNQSAQEKKVTRSSGG